MSQYYINARALGDVHIQVLDAMEQISLLLSCAPVGQPLSVNLEMARRELLSVSKYLTWAGVNNRRSSLVCQSEGGVL